MTNKLYMIILAIFTTCCGAHPKQVNSVSPEQLTSAIVAFEGYSEGDDEEGTHHKITNSYCAGVWIREDLLLTAHHCTIAGAIYAASPDIDKQQVLNVMIEAGMLEVDTLGTEMWYSTNKEVSGIRRDPTAMHRGVVIATDKAHDVAMIKTDKHPPKHLIAKISFEQPEVGSTIVLVGHPHGLTFTYVQGRVSAFRTDAKSDSLGFLGPFLQCDISVSGGMSGGGVFNSNGELVGIMSWLVEDTSQGFAVPGITLKAITKGYL